MKAFGLTAEHLVHRSLMVLHAKGNPKVEGWQARFRTR